MKFLLLTFVLTTFSTLALSEDHCAKAAQGYEQCLKTKSQAKCDAFIIGEYTGRLFQPLNRTLRGLERNESCFIAARFLKRALFPLPHESAKVYRGLGPLPELGKLRPGDCYFDKGFTSTSRNEKMARFFSSGTMFEIDVKTARSLEGEHGSEEAELILLPGTPLKLIEASYSKFKFKEVSKKECPQS